MGAICGIKNASVVPLEFQGVPLKARSPMGKEIKMSYFSRAIWFLPHIMQHVCHWWHWMLLAGGVEWGVGLVS